MPSILFMLIVIGGIGAYYGLRFWRARETATVVAPTEPEPDTSDASIATLPPPLASVDFPSETIDYPAEWPIELRYPEQFNVVDTSSGTLPGEASTGWAAKLQYHGGPKAAADVLSSFFADQGWKIVERTDLDSGGVLLLIEKDGGGSGIVVIDADIRDTNYTSIVATIFP